MRLYHGSNVKIDSINLAMCRPYKDFGKGFYLTDMKEQAEKMWPHDKSGIRILSEIFGYPDVKNPEESYSYIYVCRKKELQ